MWSGTAGNVPYSASDLGQSLNPSKPGQLESRMMLGWLNSCREQIIEEWVDRLSVLGPSYQRRPREELFETVTGAFEANWDVPGFRQNGENGAFY